MSRVAILGAGPAGLLAAETAAQMGANVSVYSVANKSILHGAQYLHRPPPEGIKAQAFRIQYKLWGKSIDYRRKVYGDAWFGEVSPDRLVQDHYGWDIRQAYDTLWDLWEDRITHFRFNSFDQANAFIGFDRYDHVFSSVPRPIWSIGGEKYHSQDIWAVGRPAHESPVSNLDDYTVICNGLEAPSWYRASNIAGHVTLEWPYLGDGSRQKPIIPGVVRVRKPLSYQANPAMQNLADQRLIHIGRYGEWQKGVLTSDAMTRVEKVLNA